MSEHTPGPWVARETIIHGKRYGGLWVEAVDKEDERGERLIPISGSGGARSYTTRVVDIQVHDDNDANARLIAAAPELLELAKLVHGSFGGGRVVTFSDEDIAAFEAVIAKAEDSTPTRLEHLAGMTPVAEAAE